MEFLEVRQRDIAAGVLHRVRLIGESGQLRGGVARVLLDDGKLGEEHLIIEVLLLGRDGKQALERAEVGDGLAADAICAFLAVGLVGELGRGNEVPVPGLELIDALMEFGRVLFRPPVLARP